MARKRRPGRRPTAPPDDGGEGILPSDRATKSVTVKLDMEERKLMGRCRRLLADAEGDSFPTASHVLRLALGALYHSLTLAPPDMGQRDPPASA